MADNSFWLTSLFPVSVCMYVCQNVASIPGRNKGKNVSSNIVRIELDIVAQKYELHVKCQTEVYLGFKGKRNTQIWLEFYNLSWKK